MAYRGRKFRLYPTKAQREVLAVHFGGSRYVYNWGLETCQKAYKETGKQPDFFALCRMLQPLKTANPWLKEPVGLSLQASLQNLDAAFRAFFRGHGRYPRFKKKIGRQSVTYPADCYVSKLQSNGWGMLRFPKIGNIRIRTHRPLTGPQRSGSRRRTCGG